jgi:hypothetical protein
MDIVAFVVKSRNILSHNSSWVASITISYFENSPHLVPFLIP